MQTLSDILGVPIKIAVAQQAAALGAAMCAAVAAGLFDRVEDAQESLGQGYDKVYVPRTEYRERYNILYDTYRKLGNFLHT